MTTITLDRGEKVAVCLDRALRDTDGLEARLRAVCDAVPGRAAFSTSLGLEDQAILHAIANSGVEIDVFTLDTGRLFPETLDTLAASENRYRLSIRVLVPDQSKSEALVARDGVLGFRQSIDARKACCAVRKVAPLARGLAGAVSWITGLRRGQSTGRTDVPFAAWDADYRLLKVNVIADWSIERLETYIKAHEIPINPLHRVGFPSIGCQPCTRAVSDGEDIRAGRWWWENPDHNECGLHRSPLSQTR